MDFKDEETIRSETLDHVCELVSRLAAGADEQNAYLHPCGWTRDEPYVHATKHPPCMPMGELCDAFDDVWPLWRDRLGPLLSVEMREASDGLSTSLGDYFSTPYEDEISTLDSAEWNQVRCVAQVTMRIVGPATSLVASSPQDAERYSASSAAPCATTGSSDVRSDRSRSGNG